MQIKRMLVAGTILAGSATLTVGTAVTVWAAGAENAGPGNVTGTQINNNNMATPTPPANGMMTPTPKPMMTPTPKPMAGTAMMPGMPMTGVNPEG